MNNVVHLEASFIEKHTSFDDLVGVLRKAFQNRRTETPMRHHHDFRNPKASKDSTLLLMPSWNPSEDLGVKVVTVSPENGKHMLPAIQGIYLYFDAHKGTLKAIMDAKSLTAKRTAAASALASDYLSVANASSLLMIGTGALSENLIRAHAAVRPIERVYVWGRSTEKAQAVCNAFASDHFEVHPVATLSEVISTVDIISCATLSEEPLVLGKDVRPGQHIDLVGAYKKNMREGDDALISKAHIFLDTYQGGLKESGDIVIPLQSGIISEADIKADLFELCTQKKIHRSPEDITVFKSVGHALEDLAAAAYYYNKHTLNADA